MNHSTKALISTAIVSSIVAVPFTLTNTAEAGTPRPNPDITIPGATVKVPDQTVSAGGVKVVVPGPVVKVPTRIVHIPGHPLPNPSHTPTQQPSTTTPARVEQTSDPTDPVQAQISPSAAITAKSGTNTPSLNINESRPPKALPSLTNSAKVVPETKQSNPQQHNDNSKKKTVIKRVVVGSLIVIALTILGILAMFFGYYLGRKDAKRYDDGFVRSLLRTLRNED